MEKQRESAAAAAELPKAIVRRVVKDKLSRCSSEDMNIHRDALVGFSESARIFIHYLSATANDICKEAKRQTMSSEDVLSALEEMEFHEFLDPLKASLHEFRRKKAALSQSKDANKKKKRKLEDEEASHENGDENDQDNSNNKSAAEEEQELEA